MLPDATKSLNYTLDYIKLMWEDVEFGDVTTVAAPTMTSAASVEKGQAVLLSGPEGATIRYTLDGSEPTTESTEYTGPIRATTKGVMTIKAIAVKGGVSSEVVTFTVNVIGTASEMKWDDLNITSLGITRNSRRLYIVGGVLHVLCRGNDLSSRRYGGDCVTVTHPYLRIFRKSLEQGILDINGGEMRTAVFAAVSLLHLASASMGDELRTIADAQHWQATGKAAEVDLERLRVVHRIRRAAENNTDNIGVVLRIFVVRQDFAERVELADATSDELRSLRTKV